MHTYIHTYIYMYVCMYIYVCIYIYIFIYICVVCTFKYIVSNFLYLHFSKTGHCSLVTCTGKMEECRNNGSHGICVCKAGYYKATGSKQCEKDCEASFCLNSGKCQQGPNGRVCICASGYSGDRCQTESKSNTVVIVVCVIAAVVVVAIFAFILYKKKRTAYRLQKTSRLDNSSSPDHSPGYPMKSYLNPRFDIHGDEEQSNASASPSPTVHSFSNKVAAEPFEYNETDR